MFWGLIRKDEGKIILIEAYKLKIFDSINVGPGFLTKAQIFRIWDFQNRIFSV